MAVPKPNIAIAWADSSILLTEPNDAKKSLGWVVEKPAVEFMNWLQNRMDTYLQHVNERGIPAWDVDTLYLIGARVYESGIIYKAVIANNGNTPSTDDGTNWREDSGLRAITEVANQFTDAPHQTTSISAVNTSAITFSAALTAGVYSTLLDITSGSGFVKLLYFLGNDATARVLSLKVTIDGNVVFEADSDALSTAYRGVLAFGSLVNALPVAVLPTHNAYFDSSLKVEVKSSIGELINITTAHITYEFV